MQDPSLSLHFGHLWGSLPGVSPSLIIWGHLVPWIHRAFAGANIFSVTCPAGHCQLVLGRPWPKLGQSAPSFWMWDWRRVTSWSQSARTFPVLGLTVPCPEKPLSQFSSVPQLCLTLCDPMDYSMPGFPVHHQLPEPTYTHVHHLGDAIQPSHPLSSPSPPAPNPSQHQSLFQWVNSSHEVAKVLEFQL